MPRSDKAAPALVIALWAGLSLPRLLSGDTLPARDLAATYPPWRHVWAGQVCAGVRPLWDPTSNHGRPLWADPDHAAAYPPTLLCAAPGPAAVGAAAGAPRHGPGPRPAGAGEG